MKQDTLIPTYFPNLDGFRFLAFCLVFLNHAFVLEESPAGRFEIIKEGLLRNGGSGVSFFFVLSGFLITHKIVSSDVQFSLRNFYIRRILRIWPLYFICLGTLYIFASLPLLSGAVSTRDFHWTYWTFLSNFHLIDKLLQSIPVILPLDVTWSISIEEQFYLCWPLVFIIIKSYNARFIVLISLIASSLIFRIYVREDDAVHYFHSISALYELSLGGLLALISFKENFLRARDLSSFYIKAIYVIGIVWLLLNGEQFLVKDGRLLQPLFFAFIIYDQCFSTKSFYNLGDYKLISASGKYTYGMYLLHPISLWGTQYLFLRLHIYEEVVVALVSFLVTIFTSVIVYHLFEQKILQLKTHFK